MTKLYCSVILVFLASVMETSGQNAPKIIPPSPDVAALMKYTEIPVNLYNGVPNIDIPLHEVKQKDITLPISLSYHASGIKVSEEATWVGLGWSLNAGGVISRSVVGQDDLEGDYLTTPVPDITDLSSLVSNTASPFIYFGCSPAIQGIDFCGLMGRHTSPADFEPDQFSFNFPGASGKFILNRSGEVVLQKQEKLEFTYDKINKKWKLRDADGFVYRFDKYETERDQGDSREVVTAWYLTQIESPLGHSITLNYTQDVDYNLFTIGGVVESRSISVVKGGVVPSFSLSTQKTYRRWTLESIDYAHGIVKFQSSTSRNDLQGGRKLTKIEIHGKDSSGQMIAIAQKEFEFAYDYFHGDTDNISFYPYIQQNFVTERLKLISVTEKAGSQTKPPYTFDYIDSGLLPGKASFAQDFWGYYNGHSGSSHLIPELNTILDFGMDGNHSFSLVHQVGQDRGVDPNRAKTYALSKIQYPTGGATEFEYECNDYDPELSGIDVAGGGSTPLQIVTKAQDVNATWGQTTITELDLTNAYVNPGDGKVYFTLMVNFRCHHLSNGCQDVVANNYDAYFELHTNSTATHPYMDGGGNPRVDFTDATFCYNTEPICYRGPFPFAVEPGVYYVKAHWDTSVDLMGMSAKFTWQEEEEAPVAENGDDGLAGGLRIATITDTDADGHSYIRRFEYDYLADKDSDGDNELYSYGRLMDFPHHLSYQLDYDWKLVWQGVQQDPQYVTFYQSSNSNVPLGIHGITVGYDQVTELKCEDSGDYKGRLGKSVYKYHNRTAAVPYGDSRLAGTPNANINSNGLLSVRTDYRFNGIGHDPVKETTNTYTFDAIDYGHPPATAANSKVIYGVKRRAPEHFTDVGCEPGDLCPPQPGNELVELYFYPAIHSEWIRQISTTEKEFSSDGSNESVTSTTTFEYETNPVHYQTKKTINNTSDGHVLVTETTYPADASSGAMPAMWNPMQSGYRHMHAQPIKQVTYRDAQATSRTENQYTQVATTSTGEPVIALTLTETFPTATTDGKTLQYSYDQNANIISTRLEDDITTSYLWGYGNGLPIAQIINAQPQAVAFTSFEVDGELGNWSVANPNYTTVEKKTGHRALNGGTITCNPAAGNYVISLWAQGAAPAITGSTPVRTRTGGSWTYYEWLVTISNSVTIQTNGAKVDDARLYPQGATMTTFTYDPLVGITSTSDANSMTSYYEYDALGRLEAIRDHKGNLIKGYTYHYRNQP